MNFQSEVRPKVVQFGFQEAPGGTPILGRIRDVRPEWMAFPDRKLADGVNF